MVKKRIWGLCGNNCFTSYSVKYRLFIALVLICNLRATIADSISTFYSFPIHGTHLNKAPLSSETQIVELQPSTNADQVAATLRPERKLTDAKGKDRSEVKC